MSHPGYTIVNFGKFKGRTFEDIYTNERGYCAWLLNTKTSHVDTLKLQQYIRYHGLRTADMNKRATCQYCKGVFPGQIQLETHIKSEHDAEKRQDEKWAVQMAWKSDKF